MSRRYFDLAFTPSVLAQQRQYHTREHYQKFASSADTPEQLGPTEVAFIAERETIYMASVSETGWPYIQHRGGPKGFLHVLDARTLAFADFRGNGQYISLGNITANNRVSLLLMDYAHRRRLKILGTGSWSDARSNPTLHAQVVHPEYEAKIERLFIIAVQAFDWNCPQHITPRYTEEEMQPHLTALQARIGELEAHLASTLAVRTSSR